MTRSAAQTLCDLISIAQPIIQAPMAGTSTPEMAAAVSNAGGLGSLGVGAMAAPAAMRAIQAFRQQSQRPLNVNVFCHRPAKPDAGREAAWIERLRPVFAEAGAAPPDKLDEIYTSFVVDEAMFAALLEAKPAVLSFHFGLPRPAWIRTLREAGIVLFATATNLADAQAAVAAGVQVIVAQGYEAGGHRGVLDPDAPDDRLGTFALTQILARRLDVPVVAAGGIMDGRGIAAALQLGAAGAQLGTAFVGATESAADPGYRAALFSEAAHHTVMTGAISGRPARCLANRFTALAADVLPGQVPDYPIAYDAGKALNLAHKAKGEAGFGAQWAGQGAPMARSMPAGKLMEALVAEMQGRSG